MAEAVAVLDVGKTNTKLTLVERGGKTIAARSRANAIVSGEGPRPLDVGAIDGWTIATLRELAREATILAIVPVAHGAAAAYVEGERLAIPVLDYESEIPEDVLRAYRAERDPFASTLSPALPNGLNLGAQLSWQEQLHPESRAPGITILPWPQFWAWRLSGIAASEATSLGCHSDLWFPNERTFSGLARSRGWDRRLAPLRRADEILGTIRGEVAETTGLPRDCKVLCGLHDSNASLLAARGMAGLGATFAVVSTGTWFVALQSGRGTSVGLDPARDTLANVDVDAQATPSARFMGGREYELVVGDALGAAPTREDTSRAMERGAMALPSFVAGSGPFPRTRGRVVGSPGTHGERAALGSLYLALMTRVCLELIDAKGPVLLEGRFALDPVFPSALASLETSRPVHVAPVVDGVALGAARLVWPDLVLSAPRPVDPLDLDLGKYADAWSRAAAA